MDEENSCQAIVTYLLALGFDFYLIELALLYLPNHFRLSQPLMVSIEVESVIMTFFPPY